MEVSEAIQKRVTIRRWKQKPVEKEKIMQVLESGRRAPSWGNVQPWRYVVVQDKAKIEELAKSERRTTPHRHCSCRDCLLRRHGSIFAKNASGIVETACRCGRDGLAG